MGMMGTTGMMGTMGMMGTSGMLGVRDMGIMGMGMIVCQCFVPRESCIRQQYLQSEPPLPPQPALPTLPCTLSTTLPCTLSTAATTEPAACIAACTQHGCSAAGPGPTHMCMAAQLLAPVSPQHVPHTKCAAPPVASIHWHMCVGLPQ